MTNRDSREPNNNHPSGPSADRLRERMNERIDRRHMLRGLARLLVSVATPDPGGILSGMAGEETATPIAATAPPHNGNGTPALEAISDPRALLAEALRAAEAIPDVGERVSALAAVAEAYIKAGEPARAKTVVASAQQALARTESDHLPNACRELVEALAAVGDLTGARTLVRAIGEPSARAYSLSSLAVAEARSGDITAATTTIERIAASPEHPVAALAATHRGIAAAHRDRGDVAGSKTAIAALRNAAARMSAPEERARWEREAVTTLAFHDTTAARNHADTIRDAAERARTLALLAEARPETAYREGTGRSAAEAALTAAESVKDDAARAFALGRTAGALARTGAKERARQVIEQASALIRRLPEAGPRAEAYLTLARAASVLPDAEPLFTLARQEAERVTNPTERITVLVEIASAMRQADLPANVTALVLEVARQARKAVDTLPAASPDRAFALVALAEALLA